MHFMGPVRAHRTLLTSRIVNPYTASEAQRAKPQVCGSARPVAKPENRRSV